MKDKTLRLAEILSGQSNSEEVYTSDQKKRDWRTNKGQFSRNPFIFDFLGLYSKWPSLTGKMMSTNTIPLKIRNNVLIILTRHSVFATELSFMADDILKKLHEQMPTLKAQVKKLKFITSPSAFELIKEQEQVEPIKKKIIHQYSPQVIAAKKHAQDIFDDIEDEELVDIFTNLYIQKSI